MDNTLDRIRENLVAFFQDLVAFFQMVFNFFVDGFNSMPKTSESDAEETTA